jgi:radical SAM/Cys-rich protein
MHATFPLLQETGFPRIVRKRLEVLQVNVGYRCNQQCLHCHVNASPRRKEMMEPEIVREVIDFLRRAKPKTLDITGGAPELNPHFKNLVESARALGVQVIDRCNLTILEEPDHEDLASFLAAHKVEITASLPCYLEDNVDRQRGAGVFETSIAALRRLNRLGYGEDPELALHLVFNPQGPTLPPPQAALEQTYKRELKARYGIVFNRLYTLANMPIQRFGSTLISKGEFNAYLSLLKQAHRDENLDRVMCRNLISVDWEGYVYDCDFNQMLGLPLGGEKTRIRLGDLSGGDLDGAFIAVADHCYGCTAGAGSSCGGALS